jgi:hypothetical protein
MDRMAFIDQLITRAESYDLDLDDSILGFVKDGFGIDLEGEDRLDAFVGVYGMINIVLGNHPVEEPILPHFSKIEGWIFGHEQPRKVNSVNSISC